MTISKSLREFIEKARQAKIRELIAEATSKPTSATGNDLYAAFGNDVPVGPLKFTATPAPTTGMKKADTDLYDVFGEPRDSAPLKFRAG